jgi:hypothetical protein
MSATLLQRYSFNGILTGDGSLNLALQNTSTTLGTPTYTTGPVAGTQAIVISSTSYITLPYDISLNFTTTNASWSFGLWVYSTNDTGGYLTNQATTNGDGIEAGNYSNNTDPYAIANKGNTTGMNNAASRTLNCSIGGVPSSTNKWTHIWFIATSSTSISLYVNGILKKTTSITGDFSSPTPWSICKTSTQGAGKFIGYIADVRWYRGIVPPDVAQAAIATIITQPTTTPEIITPMNGCITSVGQAKFGIASLFIDGSQGRYCTLNLPTAFNTSTNNWTIEMWVYNTSFHSSSTVYGTSNNIATVFSMYSASGTARTYVQDGGPGQQSSITAYDGSGEYYNNSKSPGTNIWEHRAMCYNASTNTLTVFFNGTLVQSGTREGTTTDLFTRITLGARPDTSSSNVNLQMMQGYIDELRISTGVRYTASFTPATSAFTTDINTLVLNHFDGPLPVPIAIKNFNFNFNFQESKPVYANIGIGTNNPKKTLDINGDLNVSNGIYKNNQQLTIWSQLNNDIYYNKGSVGINKNALSLLDINGTIRAMTRLTNSDMRLKKEIQDETLGLTFTNQLIPKTFNYINNINPEQNNIIHGFIAQDIANIDSNNDIVAIDSDGFYNIDIASLVTPLINSIKELSLENDIITEEVNKLSP